MEKIALDKIFGDDIQKVYSCKTIASTLCHCVLPSSSRVKYWLKYLKYCGLVGCQNCFVLGIALLIFFVQYL